MKRVAYDGVGEDFIAGFGQDGVFFDVDDAVVGEADIVSIETVEISVVEDSSLVRLDLVG